MKRQTKKCVVIREDCPWAGMTGYATFVPNKYSNCIAFQSETGTYPHQANLLITEIKYLSDEIVEREF